MSTQRLSGKAFWPWTFAGSDKRPAEQKLKPAETARAANASGTVDGSRKIMKKAEPIRETVESVVIAFVLAFLFRTFLAEAFVIPTGSMAPTLMGRHKDFTCTQCSHHYTVGASDEVDKDTGQLYNRLKTSTCPNCAFVNDIYDRPVFNGDRILVNKFPYELSEPDRFDVFVFRYPEDPQTNYIKRLVGLPGESLKIDRGDLYARKGWQGEFQILRKSDPNKQRLLQQTVYDDTQPPKLLLQHGWPERWAAMSRNPADSGSEWQLAESGWQHDPERRTFATNAAADWSWLRYRHLTPKPKDWDRALNSSPPDHEPRPELISDFCGYNAHRSEIRDFHDADEQPDQIWVGDLSLDARIDIQKLEGDAPAIQLELVEGVRRYWCEFDLKSGQVQLLRNDELKGDDSLIALTSSPNGIRGIGRHDVCFANVDDRVCLWIDNRLVKFGPEVEYTPPVVSQPQQADLHPVGLALRNVQAVVSDLVIHRDIYYRASKRAGEGEGSRGLSVGLELAKVLADPQAYNEIYARKPRSIEFDPLNDDEFFAMGDNSTHSYDGRAWSMTPQSNHAHAVTRRSLIGKAFFIYWPHGIPFLNDGKGYPVVMHRMVERPRVKNYPLYSAPFYPQWWSWSRIR